MRKIIAASVAGVVLALIFYGGGYVLGTAHADARAAQLAAERGAKYAAILAGEYATRAELARSLGAATERADSIGRGLGEAISLAAKATDRNRRIEILAGAIKRTITAIAEGARSGAAGPP